MRSLQTYIEEKLAAGIIVPSKSATVSPVILVSKSSGELRVCVDYRKLNTVTETENYPLPLLEDIISSISGSVVYSKLDLEDAFHQILVTQSSCQYTAFKRKFGVFEYNSMPFGLNNAPLALEDDQEHLGIPGGDLLHYLPQQYDFNPFSRATS